MEVGQLQILRTSASGLPMAWLGYQEAAKLYHLGLVAYSFGTPIATLRGGINAKSGLQSRLEVNSIIATHHPHKKKNANNQTFVPPLSNTALFRRDNYVCLYCGFQFSHGELSRDHVQPISQGGTDTWQNVVTACKRCNNHKAGRTPEQSKMQLLAIPFTPTHPEYVYLQGHRVLSDQMDFLKAYFPRKSPLHERQS